MSCIVMNKKDYIYIGIIIILAVALVIQFKHKESCEEICWKMMKEISDQAYWKCGQALADKFWETHRNRPLAEQKKKVWNAMQYRGWETELIMENILRLEHQKE